MHTSRLGITSSLLLFCVLYLSSFAFGQSESASLSGLITDQQGRVVPGVEVVVTNTDTNAPIRALTNGSGLYVVTGLRPGHYRVSFSKEGFRRIDLVDVTLNVQDVLSRNLQLEVGASQTSITVSAEGESINTSDASVGTVIDPTLVSNLPLNGRSFQSLILLTPGITVTTSDSFSDAGQFSVNGQRANTNYLTVDGVSANIGVGLNVGGSTNMTLAGALPGMSALGGTNNLVSIDTLQEFKVQTSTYSAQFGRQPGGQVALVTRSGGNKAHGSLFEYLRNDIFDARDWFNKEPAPQPALRQNQFGGTFSGPVIIPGLYDGHDKTFFFFSYEGQRLRLPRSGVTDIPSIRLRTAAAGSPTSSILSAFPTPSGPEISVSCDPASDPTCSPSGTKPSGFSPYNYSVSEPGSLDTSSVRIDHIVNKKLILFGRFSDSSSSSVTHFDSEITSPTQTFSSTRTLTIGANSALNSHLDNELRFNISEQRVKQSYIWDPVGGATPFDPQALTSGYGGVGSIALNFSGFYAALFTGDYADSYQRQLNIVDNVAWQKGTHQLQFGVDMRHLTPTYGIQDQQSAYFFSEPDVVNASLGELDLLTTKAAHPRFNNYSIYVQDDWKASSRLTLNLGLRWEINPPPSAPIKEMPTMAIGINGTDLSNAALAPAGTPFYKTSYAAFGPRLGLAYRLSGSKSHETVLRAGWGLFYDLGSGEATMGFPLFGSSSQFGVPYPVPPALAVRPGIPPIVLPTTSAVYAIDPNLVLPRTMQWNVAIEHSISDAQSLSLSYVGAAGRNLLVTNDLNFPAGLFEGARPNPNFSTIIYTTNGPTSDYNSLQAQYKLRFKNGVDGLVNYTWSHAIDEVSDEVNGYNLERGNANFDVRHNLSLALNYDLPAIKANPSLSYPLRDWSVDTIVHAQSGTPVDVFAGFFAVDGTFVTARPDVVPGVPLYLSDPSAPGGRQFNPAAFTLSPMNPEFPGIPARQGDFGRNILRTLPLYQVDLRLARTFSLSDALKLQFAADAFNVFNHPNFGTYGTDIGSPSTFGIPQTTLSRSLGGLNPLYQIGGPRSLQLSLRLSF